MHLGYIWGASGVYLKCIWGVSWTCLGFTWGASGVHLGCNYVARVGCIWVVSGAHTGCVWGHLGFIPQVPSNSHHGKEQIITGALGKCGFYWFLAILAILVTVRPSTTKLISFEGLLARFSSDADMQGMLWGIYNFTDWI